MPGLVLITRPIPEPGPTLVGRVADRVAASIEDRPLSVEELRERVRTVVAELPEHLRSTLLLAYFQGLKYR